ncbi:bifunctional 2',3'-cyclic-nucleotide 2'-phosphodiesterase/3'-nucleotidase [Salinarimonas ramus]|uniref:2',3'-cyclic-nucleotide 2'-phosphodiesterase n=1 Tax=Salinarimonas ramus TaxID=690164 RepID=A0A917V2U4_9HYPH|nr:bifunctional 2',3'-cyclic-nucleotide 2'-phosphodiesterase/3'-nucleotidase [Salinarimonas ramus]GGK25481.1 2',3'-cyclic-nucleotide 2'-phosphodiesterase [Salinarimonas ramus]
MPRLRLVATSDLHAHAQPWDYLRDRPNPRTGLVAAAAAIAIAREEAARDGAAVLLVDNGDLLQGAALGDLVGSAGLGPGESHPMIACLDALGCDAAGLGNHEFNYGLAFAEAAYGRASFPVVCANLARADGSALLPAFTILERAVPGLARKLRVGVTGVVPPQVLMWDKALVGDELCAEDMVDALARTVPAMRTAGADLVIALCHAGIAEGPRVGGEENAALFVAQIPGIDVVVAGHLHRVFPGGRDFAHIPGVDADAGRLHGVPAVMPGFYGSHLGIVDLDLEMTGEDGIRVAAARCEARPVPPLAEPAPPAAAALLDLTADVHARTLAHVRKPVGETRAPIDTYFTALGEDRDLALLCAAQEAFVRRAIAGSDLAALPLLSAAAPFLAGGRNGPAGYVDIPAGPLAMRDLAALYPYPNAVCAVRLTGALVVAWLERAAGLFATIDPHAAGPQRLVDPLFPSYHFDMIRGLAYTIDPTVPSRFDRDGDLLNPDARRVRDIAIDGRPLREVDVVLVATNTYRAGGGGRFCGGRLETVFTSTTLVREALHAHVEAEIARSGALALEERLAWRLADLPDTAEILYATGPGARGREPADLVLEDRGLDERGYRVYRHRGRRGP